MPCPHACNEGHIYFGACELAPGIKGIGVIEERNPERDWKEPPHRYQGKNGMQVWHIWEAYDLDPWQAAAVKYILRAGKKGPAATDYRKALDYLNYLLAREEDSLS